MSEVRFLFERSRLTLDPLFSKNYEHMTTFYRLEVELPPSVGKAGSRKLELMDGGLINTKQAQLASRRELLPCPTGVTRP